MSALRIISLFLFFILFSSCVDRHDTKPSEAILDLSVHYERAFTFLEEKKLDSAFAEFENIKSLAIEAKDSLNVANCLIQMAITLREVGDYLASQESSLEANKYLDTTNKTHHIYLSSNYNSLGNATGDLMDYESSLAFFEKAIFYSADTMNTKVIFNNKARTLSTMGEERLALDIYEEILKSENKSEKEYARSLTNYATQRAILDSTYDALPDLKKALAIRTRLDDKWGINSSYNNLSHYYETRDQELAFSFAEKRYQIALQLNSTEDLLGALHQMISVGPSLSIKGYFEEYQKLSDSLSFARTKAKNQFALIRYEVEKNKADNLRLQNEVNDKMYRINMQYLLTTAIVVVFALIGVFSFFWYKRRRQRLVLEANNRIKASQLKTSRKVHDVVANGLYRVMTEIENREDIDREGILDRLENMYEKSRDISYEVEDAIVASRQSYSELLGEMLHSYATESRQVIIAGNEADMWDSIAANVKDEIGNVIQELMVNMRKHSQADRVVLRFERQGDRLNIYYIDNGVGFSDDVSKGNGLNNTGTRMENINGTIKFVSERGGGLKVHISIPIR